MATIPGYKSRAPLDRPVNQALFAEADLEGKKGQAISSTLGQASEAMFQAKMADENIKKQTYLTNSRLELDEAMKNHSRRIIADPKIAQNPDLAPAELKKAYESEMSRLTKDAPFPRAKQDFMFDGKAYEQAATDQMLKWRDGQSLRNLEFGEDKMADLQGIEVYKNPFDEDVYKNALSNLSDIAGNFSVTMDPQLVNDKNRAYRQMAVMKRFQGVLDTATKSASAGKFKESDEAIKAGQTMLDSKDFDYDLGSEGVSKVNKALRFAKRKAAKTQKNYEYLKGLDPYKYFEKIGVALPNIDPNNIPASVAARDGALNNLNRMHKTNATLINKGDMAVMDRFLESARPGQIVQSFRKMDGMDDDLRQKYISALSQENMPMAYLANGVATGEITNDMAEEVLSGRDLLKKDKTTGISGVVMPRTNEFQSGVDAIISSRLSNPREKKAASMIVYQALAADRARREETDIDFNDDDEDAINKIVSEYMGTPISWNGSEILGPKGASENEVLNVLDSLSDESLKRSFGVPPANARGNPISIEKNRGDLKLMETEVSGVHELYFKGQPLYFPGTKLPYRFSLDEYFQAQPESVKKKGRGWFNRWMGN